MGRELQKKKRRSGLPKVRRKPPSKKKLLANPIIAANWNQKETLSQNYRRLGLVSKLNSSAGGREKDVTALAENDYATDDVLLGDGGMTVQNHIEEVPVDEVRIERDENGVMRVIEGERKANPLNDPLNDLEDSEEDEWLGFDNMGHVAQTTSTTPVVAELERHALNGVRKEPRKQSRREEEWIGRLVEKYGDDYGKMAKDMRLNIMQQSEGDIRRRVRKYNAMNGLSN